MTLRKPTHCPHCTSDRVLRIFYGLPGKEAWDIIHRGEAVAGGCSMSPGQPDWQCERCRHQWFDADDPARQDIQSLLFRASQPPPPPAPPLIKHTSGLFERTWVVQFARTVPFIDDRFAQQVLRRSEELLAGRLSPLAGAAGHELSVVARRIRPRSLEVRIARSAGETPSAVDTAVMIALEGALGRITQWQGYPRSRWPDWPISSSATRAG